MHQKSHSKEEYVIRCDWNIPEMVGYCLQDTPWGLVARDNGRNLNLQQYVYCYVCDFAKCSLT